MKIIQEYYQKSDKNGRLQGLKTKFDFYKNLYSFLTLKKYYGDVTMYCNKLAYDTVIKYIPYDDIIIKENNSKIKIIKDINVPFIYVDTSIIIFDFLFDNFKKENLDIIVKGINNKLTLGPWYFIENNKKFLIENNINITNYNNKYFDTDIVGMNTKFKEKYLEIYNKINNGFENDKIIGEYHYGYKELILEELSIYLTYINNNFSCDIIEKNLSNEYIKLNNFLLKNDKYRYLQFMFNNEYDNRVIDIIKNILKKEFSEYYNIVEEFELPNNNKFDWII